MFFRCVDFVVDGDDVITQLHLLHYMKQSNYNICSEALQRKLHDLMIYVFFALNRKQCIHCLYLLARRNQKAMLNTGSVCDPVGLLHLLLNPWHIFLSHPALSSRALSFVVSLSISHSRMYSRIFLLLSSARPKYNGISSEHFN